MWLQERTELLVWPILAGLILLVLASGDGILNADSHSGPVQLKNIAQAAGVHFSASR
jgi:hypothetical protein